MMTMVSTLTRRRSRWRWEDMAIDDSFIVDCELEDREEVQNLLCNSQWHDRNNWKSSNKFSVRRVQGGIMVRRVS